MLILLVGGPYFEKHCWALALKKYLCLEFLLFNPYRVGDGIRQITLCGRPLFSLTCIYKMGTILFLVDVRMDYEPSCVTHPSN